MINKSEIFHTSIDFVPKFGLDSNQWPHYDPDVYQQIVWDREYFFNASLTLSFTLEIAHQAFYKVTATFDILKAGFGVKEIAFWEENLLQFPNHYCGLYYLDSRMLSTTVAFETNTKPCNFKSKLAEQLSFHWDSRGEQTSFSQYNSLLNKRLHQSDDFSIKNYDGNGEAVYGLGDIAAWFFDQCHLEDDYKDTYFLRHELHHKESWLPPVLFESFSSIKEVYASTCFW